MNILQELSKKVVDIGTDQERLYELWKSTNMLDGLDEETARKVADGFTKMARYLFVTESAYLGVGTCVRLSCREGNLFKVWRSK